MARKASDTVQLKLRFPEALRRRLEREAKRHGRSLNSEILAILEGAFQQSDNVESRAKAIAEAFGDEIVSAIMEQAKRIEADERALTPERIAAMTPEEKQGFEESLRRIRLSEEQWFERERRNRELKSSTSGIRRFMEFMERQLSPEEQELVKKIAKWSLQPEEQDQEKLQRRTKDQVTATTSLPPPTESNK